MLSFSLFFLKIGGWISHITNGYIFGIVGITFLVMSVAEYIFQKSYMKKNDIEVKFSALSSNNLYILKSTLVRFFALLVPFLFFYAIVQNHYYFTHSQAFKPTRELFDIVLIIFSIFAIPYIFITLKYKGDKRYELNDYAILFIIALRSFFYLFKCKIMKEKPEYRLYKNRRIKKVMLLYLVNFFFLTLMIRFIVQEFHGFENEFSKIWSDSFTNLNWYRQYKTWFLVIFHLLFTVDLSIAIIGYLVASRWLLNRTKSVDATLSGWMVALMCYPPFNDITTQLFGYTNLPTYNLITNEYLLAAILTMVISLYFIYVWATAALGFKFSNLTNRGIVDIGPYAFVRHPAYSAKNLAWWMDNTFVLTNIWAAVAMAIWNLIYILRALTEESHLKKDEDYRKYMKKVKYRFIPKIT